MKRNTVKFRIAALITLLTFVLSILLIGFMLYVSSSVVEHTAKDMLWQTVKNNILYISTDENGMNISDDFHFEQNGVSLLIYSGEKALLAGQIPVSFDVQPEFEHGEIRTISSGDAEFYVLDISLKFNWEKNLWVRGLMKSADNMAFTQNFLQITMLSMPLFIFMAALGTYFILKRSFKPLDGIISAASSINEAKDLSLRLEIPKEKDEFSMLARTFNRLFSRLERSFESEKRFISDVSHELRTPISVIKSACEYSEKYDDAAEEYKESISMIHRQADKMSLLVAQLLSISRIEQGTENIKMEKLDLGEFTEQFCIEQKYVNINIDAKRQVFVSADKMLIARLLQNLIENAYKYGNEEKTVWVSVKSENGQAVLSVKDNGIGIAEEHQKKIWQRFYQVDPARSEESGAGLGLSMVQQIAELHNGKMSVESKLGEGSCFSLNIPLLEKDIKKKDD